MILYASQIKKLLKNQMVENMKINHTCTCFLPRITEIFEYIAKIALHIHINGYRQICNFLDAFLSSDFVRGGSL